MQNWENTTNIPYLKKKNHTMNEKMFSNLMSQVEE